MKQVVLNNSFDRPGIEKPTELEVLGMYKAARDAFSKFAQASGTVITDSETSNVYEEMCRNKISGFKRGFNHTMKAGKAIFHSRLESHEYSAMYSHSTYGHVEIMVEGSSALVKAVIKAWNNGKQTTWEELNPIIRQYFKDKQHCYGLCRDA